jgi:hypothetical protein
MIGAAMLDYATDLSLRAGGGRSFCARSRQYPTEVARALLVGYGLNAILPLYWRAISSRIPQNEC